MAERVAADNSEVICHATLNTNLVGGNGLEGRRGSKGRTGGSNFSLCAVRKFTLMTCN